jgi:hypothetical protein
MLVCVQKLLVVSAFTSKEHLYIIVLIYIGASIRGLVHTNSLVSSIFKECKKKPKILKKLITPEIWILLTFPIIHGNSW